MINNFSRFLDWGEKTTKTDTRYLARGSFWLLSAQIFSTLTGFLLAIAFANLIPKDVYGTYRFVLTAAGIVGVLSLTGMRMSVVQSVSRGLDGVLNFGVSKYIKWSFAIPLICFFISIYYYLNDNTILSLSFLVAGSLMPFNNAMELSYSFLEGKKAFRQQTFASVVRNTLSLGALVGALFVTDNVIYIVAAFYGSLTVAGLSSYLFVLYRYRPGYQVVNTSLSFGKHLSLMGLMTKVAGRIDYLIVFHFLGAAPLASYLFAKALPKELQSVNKVIKTLTLPKFSGRSLESIKKQIVHKAIVLFLFYLVIAGLYILAAPFIFKAVFPQYLDAVIYSQVLALTLLFSPSVLFNTALVAHMSKKELYILSTIIPLVRIVSMLIAIPLYGIWGAIVVTVFIDAVRLILLVFLFFNNKQIDLSR